ncbi:hypothetical protein BX285_6212 [Streptomyces sp. 1114.5]|uniref:hypothetical protein n=1 Tax=unclassified Streptomyces TaxID=2593676 RepID=UPI000BD0F2FA|nr:MULTISPECIES: hypothetical protein [unclassified Streptomyces]RKT12245.1 hypothetical protein BX285_6212 [Streptomyces sp. 1114.5]SOB79597.1 hypothetical protein SAMN06272789_0514 [Streptomyces sp. 1331.2]
MRWSALYARSRQVPASAAVVLLVAAAVWLFDRGGPADLGTVVLALTANVVAGSVGLGGPDVVLERTAAIRWAPRRAAHVLLIGAAAGAALLAVRAAGGQLAPVEVVVRDSAGLVGLAALGAVLCGAQFAWALPTGWLGFTVLVPTPDGRVGEVAKWMLFPPGTAASTATAAALLVTGTLLYAVAGPRQ